MAIAYCTCGTAWSSTGRWRTEMRKFWQGLGRTIFWSYERGSWPYDIMVVAIVMFVMLTPRKWFHDQPRSAEAATPGVQVISRTADSENTTYRVQAEILAPEKRATRSTPELEREVHDILEQNVSSLQDRMFQIVQIEVVQSNKGEVLYYDVTIRL